MTDDELKGLFDAMRQDIGAIRADTTALGKEIRAENAVAHAETRRHFEKETGAIRAENAAAHAETRRHFEKETGAIRAENAAAHAETRRHFEVVMEATRPEIRLIAESVSMVNEKLDRSVAELHEEIDRTASETQALLKYSYDRLDQRVSALENK